MDSKDSVKQAVRTRYGRLAQQGGSCCSGAKTVQVKTISKQVGYTDQQLSEAPEGANLGLGCGNPVALASLRPGDVVLDLGAGGGFDCFLAAKQVGPSGKVIGVDMTAAMLEKARENAKKGDYPNVEFRLGEIENLPVADQVVDVVLSNCVINLSPDKDRVFSEIHRVLKPGGRFMISDMVWLKEPPAFIRESLDAYASCVGGALLKDDYLQSIERSGLTEVKVVSETAFPQDVILSDPDLKDFVTEHKLPASQVSELAATVKSIKVSGKKPK